jgi:hypothetical protein
LDGGQQEQHKQSQDREKEAKRSPQKPAAIFVLRHQDAGDDDDEVENRASEADQALGCAKQSRNIVVVHSLFWFTLSSARQCDTPGNGGRLNFAPLLGFCLILHLASWD